MHLNKLKAKLRKLASKQKAKILQGFFKTGPGEYGEGDIFLGINVPKVRSVAQEFDNLSLAEVDKLIHSKIHEERLCALMILIDKFDKANAKDRQSIFNAYLYNSLYINNWDLVDLSAPNIVGNFLVDKSRKILYRLAKSKNLWQRRISIVSTHYFIRNHDFADTLAISEILLNDKEDLIHKATGWMLREVGKRDILVLKNFLKKYCKVMPRTMLRYAIEKFPNNIRLKYLKGG